MNVQRQLAHIYLFRDDFKAAFQMFAEVMRLLPADEDACFIVPLWRWGRRNLKLPSGTLTVW